MKITFLSLLIFMNMESQSQDVFKNDKNVANNGYDLVNYFQTYSSMRGNKAYSVSHQGVTYYFISADNKEIFVKEPSKYLPQFGGYCAFGMAKMNQKVPVNPETFLIDDGKLYLFFNDIYEGAMFNTIVPWVNNEGDLKPLAESNWSALKD